MTILADRLRSETRLLHTDAERSPTMRALLRGVITRPAYAHLLMNLLAIYHALEPALERHSMHPLLAPVRSPDLLRCAAIRADLLTLGCDGTALVRATQTYIARINEIDASAPHLLLAHAYVRYLGDLNGGQVLGRIVAANPALGSPPPVAFYRFDDAAANIARFRHGLTSLRPNDTEANDIVAEAVRSFGLHIEMFDQLAAA